MKHHLKHVFTQATLWLCLLCAAAWAPLARADNAAEWRRIAQDIRDKALFEGTPQDMYLRAGNFSRNGDSDKARKIYQHLVQRHSSSPFAVRASDQLDAMSRQQSIETMGREAENRANCQANLNNRLANCMGNRLCEIDVHNIWRCN